MEVRFHKLVIGLVVAFAAVASFVPAAVGGIGPKSDANERLGAAPPDGLALRAAIAQLDAHSRGGTVLPSTHGVFLDAADRTDVGRATVPTVPEVEPHGVGFSWHDAGIGAGAAFLLAGALGLLVVLGMRQSRRRVALP